MKKSPLIGKIIDKHKLTEENINEMYTLFQKYFQCAEKSFRDDLNEKQFIILILEQDSQKIIGFSSVLIMEIMVEKRKIHIVFSGDTIVDEKRRNDNVLIKSFIELNLKFISKYEKLYWFLISMGYRTYRILPILFKEFWPRYDKPTPPEIKKIIDITAQNKFGIYYNSKRGIIKPKAKNKLKPQFAMIPSTGLKDPHIKFFIEKNPGYIQGEELACITELSKKNFNKTLLRRFGFDI